MGNGNEGRSRDATLIPVDRKSLPSNCKIIPTSIQLKSKRSPTDASITRYKARICAEAIY